MRSKVKRQKHDSALTKERSAGVLLHITSLPGSFGTGDLGPEARKFANFLKRSGQRHWQILPLNPTEEDKGYSPYSSYSSIAGHTLLISIEDMVGAGWLRNEDLRGIRIKSSEKSDFKYAEEIKSVLFEKAFLVFKENGTKHDRDAFEKFCNTEKTWLDDFALFVLLKKIHQGKPWYDWEEEFKDRQPRALRKLSKEHSYEIESTKWLQFVFFQQWYKLKSYCNDNGLNLFGDLPFYVSHDSVDVWSHREIFSLDKRGNLQFVAGVPPDYFNENGQLWGMPVFRWDVLKKNNYGWWINRLKKNIALFDLLRLDHFRAFASYWAVHAGEPTAKNGMWKRGPGRDFFATITRAIGSLPFVAEDLGDIDSAVYNLRDTFQFPGMKVLHFAFSDNMPESDYIPHNYSENFIVYTGTHDNNTTRGWFKKDISETERNNLKQYLGTDRLTSRNVHTYLLRLAYASVARIAIIPAQDLVGLDEKARFNAPATIKHNWVWRLEPQLLDKKLERWLKEQINAFNR